MAVGWVQSPMGGRKRVGPQKEEEEEGNDVDEWIGRERWR